MQLDPSGILVLIGYSDGVLRLFAIESEGDSLGGGGNIYRVTRSLSARYGELKADSINWTWPGTGRLFMGSNEINDESDDCNE